MQLWLFLTVTQSLLQKRSPDGLPHGDELNALVNSDKKVERRCLVRW